MNKVFKSLVISFLLLLAACTDYTAEIKDEYEEKLVAGKVTCDKDIEGRMVVTKDGGKRVCKSGSWVLKNSEEELNSSESKKSSSSSAKDSSTPSDDNSAETKKSSSSTEGKSDDGVSDLYVCSDGRFVADTEYCEDEIVYAFHGIEIYESEVVAELGKCTSKISDSIGEVNDVHFICQEGSWKEASTAQIDTYRWAPGEDGDSKWGDYVKKNCYVYDTSATYKGWRLGESVDCNVYLGVGGCTSGRMGTFEKIDSGTYSGKYFICSSEGWKLVSNEIAEEVWPEKCDVNGKSVYGKVHTSELYMCDNGLWRLAKLIEFTYGICNSLNYSQFSEDGKKVCDSDGWRDASCPERVAQALCTEALAESEDRYAECADGYTYICMDNEWKKASVYDFDLSKYDFFNSSIDYGILEDVRDGHVYKTVVIGEAEWMAENLQFVDNKNGSYLIGQTWCMDEDEKNCDVLGRLYSWIAALAINPEYIESFESVKELTANLPKGMLNGVQQGVCPAGWHIPSFSEWKRLFVAADSKVLNLLSNNVPGLPKFSSAGNSSGFSVIPAGCANDNSNSCVWEHEHVFIAKEYPVTLGYVSDNINSYSTASTRAGYSVRCVKD